jgi:hypothetical protein
MEMVLKLIFNIAGVGVGAFFIWNEVSYLLNATYAGAFSAGPQQETARLTFTRLLEAGEHSLLYLTLIVLPVMYYLSKIVWHKMYSALVVLVFAGLCVLLAQIIHTSIIDGYVFYLSQKKQWADLAWPAAVLIIVAVNWFMAFGEMYRVVNVAGR